VRGKYDWRLTGVEDVSSLISSKIKQRRQAGRIAKLLLRLIQGQEGAAPLFDTVRDGLSSLAHTEEESAAESIEVVLVLRVLAKLGYLPNTPELRPFIETDFFSLELASKARESRRKIIKAINDSLSATGL
jgi:hypothetical protein